MPGSRSSVLFVSPFKSTRGYAWFFIGRLYARIADHLATDGIATFVAYPSRPRRRLWKEVWPSLSYSMPHSVPANPFAPRRH
jgi:hypothetical protein